MRGTVGFFYWFLVGMLAIFGLYGSLAGETVLYPLLIPAALALFGAWWPGLGYAWAVFVGFGAYPALFLTMSLLNAITSAVWWCTRVEFGAPGDAHSGCSVVAGEHLVATLIFWAITLLGVTLGLRTRDRSPAA